MENLKSGLSIKIQVHARSFNKNHQGDLKLGNLIKPEVAQENKVLYRKL